MHKESATKKIYKYVRNVDTVVKRLLFYIMFNGSLIIRRDNYNKKQNKVGSENYFLNKGLMQNFLVITFFINPDNIILRIYKEKMGYSIN